MHYYCDVFETGFRVSMSMFPKQACKFTSRLSSQILFQGFSAVFQRINISFVAVTKVSGL